MIKLIDCYGIEVVKKEKNRYYFPELKQEINYKALLKDFSQRGASLDYTLPNYSMMLN